MRFNGIFGSSGSGGCHHGGGHTGIRPSSARLPSAFPVVHSMIYFKSDSPALGSILTSFNSQNIMADVCHPIFMAVLAQISHSSITKTSISYSLSIQA